MQITFKSCHTSKLLKIDEVGEYIVGEDDSFRQEIIHMVLDAVRNGDLTPRTKNGRKDPPDWPVDEDSADKQEDKGKQFVRFHQLVRWLRSEKGFDVKTAASSIPSEGVPQSVSDLANVGYDDLLTICSIENEEDFHGFRVEPDGIYKKRYDPDEWRQLFPTERAVLAWHPTGEYDKPALSLPCTLGQLRFFVIEAGLTGIIDEETVHEVLDDRIEHDKARALLSSGEGAAPDSFEAKVAAVNLTDERGIELAHSPHLGIADWTELTGVGCGKCGSYLISAEAVAFRNWTKREIRDASVDRQIKMHRDNETTPLEFPCTPARLVEFIDAKPPEPHGFSVPDAFRQTATASGQATESATGSTNSPEEHEPVYFAATEKAAVPREMPGDDSEQTTVETTLLGKLPHGRRPDGAEHVRITTHLLARRSSSISPVIQKASSEALSPEDPQSVWASLVSIAESNERPAPLIGYTDTEGVKYKNTQDETKFLTYKNLRDRMRRSALRRAKAR